MDAIVLIQQIFEVNGTVARDLLFAISPEVSYAPLHQGLFDWLTDFVSCMTGAGFQVADAIQVLQRQPCLKVVRVDAIHKALTQLSGKLRPHSQRSRHHAILAVNVAYMVNRPLHC